MVVTTCIVAAVWLCVCLGRRQLLLFVLVVFKLVCSGMFNASATVANARTLVGLIAWRYAATFSTGTHGKQRQLIKMTEAYRILHIADRTQQTIAAC